MRNQVKSSYYIRSLPNTTIITSLNQYILTLFYIPKCKGLYYFCKSYDLEKYLAGLNPLHCKVSKSYVTCAVRYLNKSYFQGAAARASISKYLVYIPQCTLYIHSYLLYYTKSRRELSLSSNGVWSRNLPTARVAQNPSWAYVSIIIFSFVRGFAKNSVLFVFVLTSAFSILRVQVRGIYTTIL